MQVVIVTGISGSGKSTAVKALEDIGYYCVDNIPPALIPKFIEICTQSPATINNVAIVADARNKEMLGELLLQIRNTTSEKVKFNILFLDANDGVITRRYKETRRIHPLMGEKAATIDAALTLEREMLSTIRENANYVIDTSLLSGKQLRETVISYYISDDEESFSISCMSFGFKYGIPSDADLVFDVRCLPNPHYIDELREKTGMDQVVRDYVMKFGQSQELFKRICDLVDFSIPLYRDDEGKTHLNIAVGCTGGKHRSVTFAKLLSEHISKSGVKTTSLHRDIKKIKP